MPLSPSFPLSPAYSCFFTLYPPLCTSFILYTSLSATSTLPHSLPLSLPLPPPPLPPPTCHFPSAIVAPFICLLFAVVFVVVVSCHCLCLLLQPLHSIYTSLFPSLLRSSCVYFLFYISSRARITVTHKSESEARTASRTRILCVYSAVLSCSPATPSSSVPTHHCLSLACPGHSPLWPSALTLVKGKNLLCLIIIFLLTIRDAYAKKDNPS